MAPTQETCMEQVREETPETITIREIDNNLHFLLGPLQETYIQDPIVQFPMSVDKIYILQIGIAGDLFPPMVIVTHGIHAGVWWFPERIRDLDNRLLPVLLYPILQQHRRRRSSTCITRYEEVSALERLT